MRVSRGQGPQNNTKNSLYGLYKIHLNKEHLSQVKLSVLSGQEFYVFQDNQLIYSKDSNNYYHGKSEMQDHYINISYNPNDNEFKDFVMFPLDANAFDIHWRTVCVMMVPYAFDLKLYA